jgi:lipopolysaccharide export system permease protein
LLRHPTRNNLAEFAWRTGLPLMAINLMLLGIPLAYQNPRRGRTINLVMAVLIFLTYSNLLNVMQSWLEQGKISFVAGLVSLHIVAAIVVVAVFWLRVRNRPLIPRSWFASARGA